FAALATQSMRVTGLDHPGQLELARRHVAAEGDPEKFETVAIDLGDVSASFPRGFDSVWLCQLLDCFPEPLVQSLLERAAAALSPTGRVYVVEPYCDRQRRAPSRIALHGTSLYFACVANGQSRMYHSSDILACVQAAGLEVELDRPAGPWHSLWVLKRR
ncbi:MAG: class I SAM-dependent methyltransferase, partial [Myxococcaceae bacterium]|nr:class I SAM-dependent methyltransferase [Myxococcaceae bacterium]